MKNRQNIIRSVIFFSILVLGFVAFHFGVEFATTTDTRGPAAIPKNYDYSHLEGEALKSAALDRLISGSKVVTAGKSVGIELGHFSVKDETGQPVTACQKYSKIEFTFVAGDMAVSGESPEMKIEGPCTPGDDINFISPLFIQYDKILSMHVADQVIQNFEDSEVKMTLKNVSDSWPKTWILNQVRLISNDGIEFRAESDDIRRIHGTAISMEWQ